MYSSQKPSSGFPNPLADALEKQSKKYGLRYAKAIEGQWGKMSDKNSMHGSRNGTFKRNRTYANGTQDTSIYKQLLTSLNPNGGEGSLLNLDYTPVPILPKFVRIVVNKILSRNPYPNLEAVDPLSSSEKNKQKQRIRTQVAIKKELQELKSETGGLELDINPDQLPDTLEEAEIFLDTNIKTDAEVAAQVATNMTLSWCNFNDSVYRRCVNDLAAIGIAVTKRSNDPNYGIKVDYIDPLNFVHSYTEDPFFEDVIYAGHVKEITISELKRISRDEFTEDDIRKIMKVASKKRGNYDPTGYSIDNKTTKRRIQNTWFKSLILNLYLLIACSSKKSKTDMVM